MRRLVLAFVVLLTLLVPLFAAATALGAVPGTRLWVERYAVTAGDDWWSHAAKGPGGAIFLAGQREGSTAVLIAKYGTAGGLLWSASSDPSWSRATVVGVEVDGAGNCYVAGTYETEGDADSHIFVARYPSAGPGAGGSPEWQQEYNGPGSGDDVAADLTLDRAGGVYVCGGRSSTDGGSNAVAIKYRASDGWRLWVAAYSNNHASFPNDSDSATAVVAARNGTCYFAGQSQESAGVRGAFIVKLESSGRRVWAARLPHKLASRDDTVNALVLAPGGGAVVAGSAKTMTRGSDVLVGRYSPGGDPVWVRVFDTGGSENGLALRLDEYGNILVAGDRAYSAVRRGLLLKLGFAQGALRWKRLFRLAGSSASQFSSLAVDGARNAYCGGYSDDRLIVVKYSPTGVRLWSGMYRGPASGAHCRAVVYVGGTKRALYAAGGSHGVGTGEDAVLIKYAP